MPFATSTKILDFLRKLESSSAPGSFARASTKGSSCFAVHPGQNSQIGKHFAKTEAIFRQGLLHGLQGQESILARSSAFEPEFVGVFCEGAAMGLAMLDLCSKWRKKEKWRNFAQGEGKRHIYEVHVGLGLGLAQLKQPLEKAMQDLDPLYKWLVVDGYGFHAGVFNTQRYICEKQSASKPLLKHSYGNRSFDQGLGRSLWFVQSASPELIASSISSFAEARQSDLWSGVGIAAAHAGGIELADLKRLKALAGNQAEWLAQGAAFAAKVREHAGTQAAHTEMACRELCGTSAQAAATITDDALFELPHDGLEPAYEAWRMRISKALRAQDI